MMADAYIYDHVRTPRGRGRPDGALHEVAPVDLAAMALAALRERNGLDTALVDDVVLGCVESVGEQAGNIARAAALNAGYADTAGGAQINRLCASGLEAVNVAAGQVMSGQSDLVVAGGIESMSRVPMGQSGAGPQAVKPSLAMRTYYAPQGIAADMIATRWGFSREDVDSYAVESQQRAARAWSEVRFAGSIVPVKDQLGLTLLARDEHLRPETTLQSLSALKPSFAEIGEEGGFDAVLLQRYPDFERIRHVHHAENSAGMVDGAAALLIGSKEAGAAAGLRPRARIRAFCSIGSEPAIMLTGPENVARKLLRRARMSVNDIDLFELNETFASVVLLFRRVMGLDPEKLNANGGAIAMGHPLGATGAMMLGTLVDELERAGRGTGLALAGAGSGLGTATLVERI